jgi:uncharacterized protein YcaQ
METLDVAAARRLALVRAGLLANDGGAAARGRGPRARDAAVDVVRRFGYLQLDTVSIAGARSHAIVVLSRLPRLHHALPEDLLSPGAPLFEYWGHEASWIPLELYPCFEFRRREFRSHPWWGDLVGRHPDVARRILDRIRADGPLRTGDLEGERGKGFWQLGVGKRVADALWSSGELAIRERRNFQRTYDLAERVIPDDVRSRSVPEAQALRILLLQALAGHGWATGGTLARTWRLRNRKEQLDGALRTLQDEGRIVPCALVDGSRRTAGWIRPADLEWAATSTRLRPRPDRGVLLSPFDPVLWDRERVARLFGFDAVLEIYKPASRRIYGYYCLPVLAGDRFVARLDLKADRAKGKLRVLRAHFEKTARTGDRAEARAAADSALRRWAATLRLAPDGRTARRPAARKKKSSAHATVPTR